MAKSVLPSISKWEEVLDILLNPEKYKAYMVDFKAAYDKSVAILDLVTTKEEADKYLAEAMNIKIKAENAQEREEIYLKAAMEDKQATEDEYAKVVVSRKEQEALTAAYEAKFSELDSEKKKLDAEFERRLEELRIQKEEFQCFREKHAEKVAEFELRVEKLNSLIGAV